jgi:hypothetical protein
MYEFSPTATVNFAGHSEFEIQKRPKFLTNSDDTPLIAAPVGLPRNTA